MANRIESSQQWLLKTEEISYAYGQNVPVLKELNFVLKPQESVAILGVSGVGKSTFLHLLGLLDSPTSGRLLMHFKDHKAPCNVDTLSDTEKAALRCHTIGVIYQFHYLLMEFTALENVMIPQLIAGKSAAKARAKAEELLASVHLSDRLSHKPGQLSGGQQQRVAIARALANDPQLLLADEPTGNLDEATAEDVFELFCSLIQKQKLSVVMTTHNTELGRKMDRALRLHQGHLMPL